MNIPIPTYGDRQIHPVPRHFLTLVCAGVPQPVEGALGGGADGSEAGAGDPDPRHARPHGGRQLHAHALDQEDHRRGGLHRGTARAHPTAACQAL